MFTSFFHKILNLIKAKLLISFLFVFLLGGVLVYFASEKKISSECSLDLNKNKESEVDIKKIFVDLSGAVENPGLYQIDSDKRVGDLLMLGGGVSSSASAEWISKELNLSKKLSDSSKVYIPYEWEIYTPESSEILNTINNVDKNVNKSSGSDENSTAENNSSSQSDVSKDEETGTGNVEEGKTNVNTASSSDLDKLPGIGPAYAEKIISNRPYENIAEFESKSGLYKSTVEGIKDLISF